MPTLLPTLCRAQHEMKEAERAAAKHEGQMGEQEGASPAAIPSEEVRTGRNTRITPSYTLHLSHNLMTHYGEKWL